MLPPSQTDLDSLLVPLCTYKLYKGRIKTVLSYLLMMRLYLEGPPLIWALCFKGTIDTLKDAPGHVLVKNLARRSPECNHWLKQMKIKLWFR